MYVLVALVDDGGSHVVITDAMRCLKHVRWCPSRFSVSIHPWHKRYVRGAANGRSTHRDAIQCARLVRRHDGSGRRRHRFERLMAANTTRSTSLNGASLVSNFRRLLGDQRMSCMTVIVHIAGSLWPLAPLRATMRRGSRARRLIPVFLDADRPVYPDARASHR